MPGGTKRHRQDAAVAALLSEPTIAAAAAQAQVSERTLRSWLKEPGFRRAVREAGLALVGEAVGKLHGAAGIAVQALVRNLSCGQAGQEIRAALGILEQSFRGAELLDLAERVE